jgi:hypothetical protein
MPTYVSTNEYTPITSLRKNHYKHSTPDVGSIVCYVIRFRQSHDQLIFAGFSTRSVTRSHKKDH